MDIINWFVDSYENDDLLFYITIATFTILIIGIGYRFLTKIFIRSTKVSIEFDREQSGISKIVSHNKSFNNKICVVFYSLKVLGLKEKATSIKEIKFFIKNNGNLIMGNYFSPFIKSIKDKNGNEHPSVMIANKKSMMELLDWTGLKEIFNKRIEYSDVQLGSAIYYFDLTEQEFLKTKKMKFIIIDNFNRKYSYKSEFEFKFNMLDKNLQVIDFDMDLEK